MPLTVVTLQLKSVSYHSDGTGGEDLRGRQDGEVGHVGERVDDGDAGDGEDDGAGQRPGEQDSTSVTWLSGTLSIAETNTSIPLVLLIREEKAIARLEAMNESMSEESVENKNLPYIL